MSSKEWVAARSRLKTLIVGAAGRRSTVTYGEAAAEAFGGRFSARSSALMALLAELDTEVMAQEGIMIATLVVRADTGRPGEGYFAFAERTEPNALRDREGYWLERAEQVWALYDHGERS